MPLHRDPPFTIDEYRRRCVAVQGEMASQNLDLALATTMASVCYLTGIESVSPHKFWAVAVPRRGEPVLLCQDFESHNAKLTSWLDAGRTYGIVENPTEVTANLIRDLGAERGRIGVELSSWSTLSAGAYLALRRALPDAELVESDAVGLAMGIKSAPEIECLRRAGRVSKLAMDAAIASIKDGATDNDVAAEACRALWAAGGEYSAYPVIVTTGARSSVPHSTFRRTPIARGDGVFIELAGTIDRYHAPKMRVAPLGEPSPRLRELAEAATESVRTMTRTIRPGAVADDVAAASERCLAHLEGVLWHGYYGYSVGLGFPPEWSESPFVIRRGSDLVLKPGMAFHCSTSLRDVGVCGATRSETIVVTETGCEVVTE